MYYYLFILRLGVEINIWLISFPSSLWIACTVLGFHSFPSFQLSKIQTLLALQRQSCQHTHRHVGCSHLPPCLFLYLTLLFEKVKYVLWQSHIFQRIHELLPYRREHIYSIRKLTGFPTGHYNIILYTHPHTHTHTE